MKDNRLEDRFAKFVAAVHAAIEAKQNKIRFADQDVTFVSDDAALEHLFEIMINGVFYSIRDTLENKAKLAEAGWLGQDLVETGKRKMFIVQQRQGDARRKAKFAYRCELWGDLYGKRLWDAHKPNADKPRIAHATLQLIAKAAEKGYVPSSVKEARDWGLKFPRLSAQEWELVKDFSVFLTKLDIQ